MSEEKTSGASQGLAPSWRMQEVAALAGGRLSRMDAGDLRFSYDRINTDSRRLHAGDFFVALRGERHDAHDFLPAVEAAGALGALVDRPLVPSRLAQIVVEDALAGWQRWSAGHRARFPDLPLLALTGSSGKTTSKDLVAHLLAGSGPVWATPGNLNNHVGVPWTLLGLAEGHAHAVVELGMNHPGEIARLSRLVAPGAALITDVGTAHVGFLGSREAILAAKLEILEGCRDGAPLVLPHDSWVLDRLPEEARRRPRRTFGIAPEADWCPAGPVEWSLSGTRFVTARTGPVRISLLGLGGVLSALAALAAVEALGADPAALASRLESAPRRPLRMEPRRFLGADWVLDCYNASPESSRLAISFLRDVPHRGRRILVLGELGELGKHSEAIHRELGRRAGAIPVVLFVGEGARAAWEGNRASALSSEIADWTPDALAAAEWLRPRLRPGDLVMLKGSRRSALERIVQQLAPGGEAPAEGERGGRDRESGSGPASDVCRERKDD